MKDTMSPGIEIEHEVPVTDDMAPAHLPAKVLSTPAMVGMIEGVCLAAMMPHLDPGETSVGTHVSISHTGPAASGEMVRITEGHGSNQHPTWAPNGRAIAYGSSRGGLWISTADGRTERQVYKGNASTPAWSPALR